MTAIFSRQPLHPLSMSSSQRAPRRLSARLQEKEDVHPTANGFYSTSGKTAATQKGSEGKGPTAKKRKIDYDEDNDGFLFTRAKTRTFRASTPKAAPMSTQVVDDPQPNPSDKPRPANGMNDEAELARKKKRNRMSFSTPNVREEKPVRRSKRLSDERIQRESSPQHKARRKEAVEPAPAAAIRQRKDDQPLAREKTPAVVSDVIAGEEHSATRIALPFADTPIIRRNKAMREGKVGKGERRSSLGLRGRRASSLIDSGNSNALPHNEVEASDFYKHIESEGLPEPRRMRQLLTWCATRAMGGKPTGTEFEDQSARMAAWVIQEELLKDLTNRSEMSDWFTREDTPKTAVPLVMKPNPKNIQNAAKIEELEQQIKRLQAERQSLEDLLRPPSKNHIFEHSNAHAAPSATLSLLPPSDTHILDLLTSTSTSSQIISSRINSISASLGPTIDAFADGIHQIAQYRDAADSVAGQVLKICADKLEDREKEGRRHALGELAETNTPKDELGCVLRSLSRLEQ